MIRILHLENPESDPEHVCQELKKGRIKVEHLVAYNYTDFERDFLNFRPDLILISYPVPVGDSPDVLAAIRSWDYKIPVILLTPPLSEYAAAEIVKAGATDYIQKDQLHRLPQALLKVVSKRRIEAQREEYLQEAIANEAALKSLNQSLEEMVRQRTLQLVKANKELESFGYTVSHDLKAPLTVIHTSASLLELRLKDRLTEDETNFLEKIKSYSQGMGQMIEGFLRLSQVQASLNIVKEEVHLEKMVKEIAEELQKGFPHSEIHIDALETVYANPVLLRQVWTNLISNALKYSSMKAQPVVCISSHRSEDETVFLVQDNGIGFDMDEADRLFGIFQRLKSNSEVEGNGIGLAIVKRILEGHGGRVWAIGEVGVGAKFYFSLPG